MHSFLAYTSMELSVSEREALAQALTRAGEKVFPQDFSLSVHCVPERYSSPFAQKLLHFIAHVPDSITLDERREISRALQDATVATLGSAQNQRATILFWKAADCDVFDTAGISEREV